MPLFGAHVSISGGFARAVEAAAALGMETVQVFTHSPSQWAVTPASRTRRQAGGSGTGWVSKPLPSEQAAAFRQALGVTGIARPIAHNSYLINLASPDDALWERSIAAMVDELERAEALGIADLVAHPGAHVGSGEAAGLARIAAGLDAVHRRTPGHRARIALETTAGQGTCLGHRFEHLRAILERVAAPERLNICVDTCHVFAAGYSFGTPAAYNDMIEALDRAVGLDRLRVWHLNDSLRERGSRVDRHAGIGRGRIGLDAFRLVVTDPRFAALPMILETPKGTEAGRDLDAVNLAVLRGLL